MLTADQIASELTPHITANNASIGETNRRLAKIGDGQGNARPATLLTPRDVFYRSDLDQNDRGVAILHPKCPIPLQGIDGYYDTEVYIANVPGSSQVYIVDLADSGGLTTGGPTPTEALTSAAAFPSQDRFILFRLRPSPDGGLSIYVDVGVYAVAYEVGDGTLGYASSGSFGLPDPTDGTVYYPTAAALTSGQHRLVGVALNPASGQFIAIPGTASTASGTLPERSDFDESDYQAISFLGCYPCGYLYSYYGQTDFVEDDCLRLFDPRLIANKVIITDSPPLIAKGDLYTRTASADARLATSLDNSSLITDSTQPTGNRWKSPYFVGAYNYDLNTGHYRIGTGFSDDGRRLSRTLEPAVDIVASTWESDNVHAPYLLNVNGVLWLFYDGSDGTWRFGVARSFDGGLTWIKYASNPILAPSQSWENNGGANMIWFPTVLYDVAETDATKRWKMWYAGGLIGSSGIGYAYSADGLSWTKYSGNPVLTPAGSGWETSNTVPTGVIRVNNTYYLFYGAKDGSSVSQVGLITFTNPTGTYTRSANNPVIAGDGITTTLTANVSIGDVALAVTNASVFPIGAPVWVYDASHQYLSYISAIDITGNTVTLVDPAPVGIASSSGNMRSAAYSSVGSPRYVYFDGTGWRFSLIPFAPLITPSGLREVAMVGYADEQLTAIHIDYQAGLIVRPTLAESQAANTSLGDNTTLADLRQDAARTLNPTGGSDTDYYQTVQVNGSAQTQRGVVDFIAGTNVTLTPADDGANDRTKVTINATGGGGGGSGIAVTTDTLYTETVIIDSLLSGSQASWDTNTILGGNIDQTYDHLKVILFARSDLASSQDSLYVTFNNDTTNGNYQRAFHGASASGNFAGNGADRSIDDVPAASEVSGQFSQASIFIPQYAAAQEKLAVALDIRPAGNSNTITSHPAMLWKNTSAITRLAVSLISGSFVAGSRFQLIGVKAKTVVTNVTGSGTVQLTTSADGTVASTASETSVLGTIVGTQALAANALGSVGRILRVTAMGYVSDTGTPTLKLKFKLGSTVILDSGAVTLGSGIGNKLWKFEGLITVQTAGASGKVIAQGQFYQNGTTTDIVNTAQASVDTSATQLIDLTAQWSASSSSNTITCTNCVVEVLN